MKPLWIALALVLGLWQSPALAEEPEIAGPVISRIETEGYTVSGVTRTWLGRIVITARNEKNLREVVINRTSGEILRDSLFALPDSANPDNRPAPDDQPGRPGGGGMGGGSGGGMGGGGGGGGGGNGGGGGGGSG